MKAVAVHCGNHHDRQLAQKLASTLRWVGDCYVNPYSTGWRWVASLWDGVWTVTGSYLALRQSGTQRACMVSVRVPRNDKALVRKAIIAAEYELTVYGIREGRCTVTTHQTAILCTIPVHVDGEPCWVDLNLWIYGER